MTIIKVSGGSNKRSVISDIANLAKILTAEHPDYEAEKVKWEDYRCWYEGRDISKYLYKHLREQKNSIDGRRKRSVWVNYCANVVDMYLHYIFSYPIVRLDDKEKIKKYEPEVNKEEEQQTPQQEQQGMFSYGDQLVEAKIAEQLKRAKKAKQLIAQEEKIGDLGEFWDNCDNNGVTIDEFMKTKVGVNCLVYGKAYVIVDMPRIEGEITTEQERIEKGLRPYLVSVPPLNLINWEKDDNGNYLWIRIKEQRSLNLGPLDERKEKKLFRYRTWTRKEWFIHEITEESGKPTEVRQIARDAHDLGIVPIVCVSNRNSLWSNVEGVSAIDSIGKLNVAIYNWLSLIDEDIYKHCLAVLLIQEAGQNAPEVTLSADNALTYRGEQPPSYLAPPSEPGEFILNMIKEAEIMIYKLAVLGGGISFLKEAQSGIAYAREFNETNRNLAEKADILECAEMKIHKIWSKWMKKEEWKGYIDYPDDFDISSSAEDIEAVTKAKTLIRSQLFKRQVEKKLARRVLGKVRKEITDVIMAEIDINEEEKQQFYPPM